MCLKKICHPRLAISKTLERAKRPADEDGRQEQVVLRYYYDIRMLQITYSFSRRKPVHMGVSKNSGTPRSSILIGFFHYKPSILGYPYFWKHPYVQYILTSEVWFQFLGRESRVLPLYNTWMQRQMNGYFVGQVGLIQKISYFFMCIYVLYKDICFFLCY